MKVKVKELNFGAIHDQVVGHTNKERWTGYDEIFTKDIAKIRDTAAAVNYFVGVLYNVVSTSVGTLAGLDLGDPLVEALVRTLRHPEARPPFKFAVDGADGPDMAPRLRELIAAPGAPGWDADTVEVRLLEGLRARAGEHMVEDTMLPWAMYWGPPRHIAYAILNLYGLRALGLL